jgi:WD40 repeat protein
MPAAWRTRWALPGDFSAAALYQSTGAGLILAGHYDGTVSLIRQDDGAMQDASLMRLTDAVVGIACGMADGHVLATAIGFDGSVVSCDLSSGRLYHLRSADPSILGCAFTPGGLVIVTERGWSACDPMTGDAVRTVDTGGEQFTEWAVGRVGGSSVVAALAEQVALWQLPSGRPLPGQPRLSLGRQPSAVALSDLPDELLIGTGDGLIRACDLKTGRLRRLARHTDRVIAITPTGTPGARHIFTASMDGLIYRTPIVGGRGLAIRLRTGLRSLAAETSTSVAVVTAPPAPPALALLDLPAP